MFSVYVNVETKGEFVKTDLDGAFDTFEEALNHANNHFSIELGKHYGYKVKIEVVELNILSRKEVFALN